MSNQDYQQSPVYQQTSSLATFSLISGIASFFILPLIGAIAAIILGNKAKQEIALSAGALTGESMARWGTILGWVNIGFSVIGICLAVLLFAGAISLPFCFIPFANGF